MVGEQYEPRLEKLMIEFYLCWLADSLFHGVKSKEVELYKYLNIFESWDHTPPYSW